MALKAMLFDAGDTLFRVRGSVGAIYAHVAARHGVVVEPESVEVRFRGAFRAMPPLVFPGVPEHELVRREHAWWRALVAQVFAAERFSHFDRFFDDLFRSFAQADSWELFPDTRPTLDALRAHGLRLGIVSNFDTRLTALCSDLGIRDAFDAIVVSSRIGHAKPDPRIFATALACLRVAPADALHVGDSEREDVAGARAAGLRAILVDRSASAASAGRVSNLRQLLQVLS